MLRSIVCKDVRLTQRHVRYSPSFSGLRYYSSVRPESSTVRKPHSPPLSSSARKSKLDLRPAPLKLKPSLNGSAALPNAPLKSNPSSKQPETISLLDVKEVAQKDISDAQRHGILVPPPPDANWFKQTLHKAIQLAKFYFRGVKLIFIRRREIAAILDRVKSGGAPLTRAEFRLITTQKDDVNKVIPFIIIALLLEEVIPLIAIYAPFMLPSTCVLPSQRERIETKRNEKALASVTTSAAIYSALKGHIENSQIPLNALKSINGSPTALCSALGLSTLGIDALRIRRIRQRLAFLAEDDQLLLQDNLSLSSQEVKEALSERGLFLNANATLSESRNLLAWWLNSVKSTSDDALATRLFLIVSRQ
ncbi:hypothetical protein FA15DRAFT_668353 [Coprinopsis marcescibilis]|uniref:Letm1 RBD domain-containing protein n=1 Tax=Coprinopsis marcescibilis TaxID=230819 RepID=A0A5C3KZ54_COPMA|nr:hypothetical protein FA15DRAFT_668353 [Coprinopsis marcescibilis]